MCYYMIHLYTGKSGQGKTLCAADKVIKLHLKWGFPVYSNIDLAIPYTLIEDSEDVMSAALLATSPIIIFVDELDQLLGDTWQSGSKDNKLGALAGKIARKNGVTLIGTVQLDNQANTRIRGNADRFITPQIVFWINIKTKKRMWAPLTLEQKELIEYSIINGVRTWQPGRVAQQIKELNKDGEIIGHPRYKIINAQKVFYDDKNILECFNSREIVLKDYGNADNDALLKAQVVEKRLTRLLLSLPSFKDVNVLRMPESGYRMSYDKFTCLDIQVSTPSGGLFWIDVVSTNDGNGHVRLQTAKKNWYRIFNSIKMYGSHAKGYIAFQDGGDWFFTPLDENNQGLHTKTGNLAKGNIYLSTVRPFCMNLDEWVTEIAALPNNQSKNHGRAFPAVVGPPVPVKSV